MSHISNPVLWRAILVVSLFCLHPTVATVSQRAFEDPLPAGSGALKDSESSVGRTDINWGGIGKASSNDIGSYIRGSSFSGSSDNADDLFSKPGEAIKELAEKVYDFVDAFDTSSTTSSSATVVEVSTSINALNVTPAPTVSEAAQGCNLFSSYISLCSSVIKPASSSVGSARPTSLALASCACYSSSYYVPAAFDKILLACAGYAITVTSAMPSTGLAALATSASRMEGFCSSVSNPRELPTTQFGKATTTSYPTVSAAASQVEVTNGGKRFGATEFGIWVAVAASVVLF